MVILTTKSLQISVNHHTKNRPVIPSDIQYVTARKVVICGYFDVAVGHRQLTNFLCVGISNETQNRNYMESTAITFDQLPHVVSGLSEKLDRVLELLEKVGIANPFNHHKSKRRKRR